MMKLFPIFLFCVQVSVAGDDAKLLQGVWKVIEIRNLDTEELTPAENSHYMITSEYIMTIGGKKDRPVVKKNFQNMTYQEIMSQLPAGGGFQKYEIVDKKIHRTTVFALSEYFEGKLIITEFEVDEQQLIFRDDHHADGQMREWVMRRLESL